MMIIIYRMHGLQSSGIVVQLLYTSFSALPFLCSITFFSHSLVLFSVTRGGRRLLQMRLCTLVRCSHLCSRLLWYDGLDTDHTPWSEVRRILAIFFFCFAGECLVAKHPR